MPLFSRLKNKGAQPASKGKNGVNGANGHLATPSRPKWVSTWNSKHVVPEEVEELLHACTVEMKSRAEALDAPFLLLPFRPNSDASGARTFIRNFFKSNQEGSNQYRGASLQRELRLTEPIVLCSIIKWCWSRMPGGVVTWPVYDGFSIGEKESSLARNAFETFIPLVADSIARKNIIFDFYDLLASVAAHGKMNGLGGRKLSRLAGWWAFEHSDDGKGFEGGYRSWSAAADASTHLFFAYLRSLSPEENPSMSLIERIPRSLQALLASTDYPPETPIFMQQPTSKVLMLVDSVSTTPFALLRRAKHFEYRDRDRVLRQYSNFEDPVQALTDECKRVLNAISNTNSTAPKSRHGAVAPPEESWSAFQNLGFSDWDEKDAKSDPRVVVSGKKPQSSSVRPEPRSRDYARPATPSWADFMSSGFAEDDWNPQSTTLLLPPDKVLPPLGSRVQSPNSMVGDDDVAPGELAAIANVNLDDTFWWVWMTSLATEEPAERKSVFGRCAVIETTITGGAWLIMEEQVKGASLDPEDGVYLAKKKGLFSFTKRSKLSRKPSIGKVPGYGNSLPAPLASPTPSKRSLAPDQQNKVREAAAALKRQDSKAENLNERRAKNEDAQSKRNSVLTMGLQSAAGPAMKWTTAYDKSTIRAQYLGNPMAGRGVSQEDLGESSATDLNGIESYMVAPAPAVSSAPAPIATDRELPALPKDDPPTPPTGISTQPEVAPVATVPDVSPIGPADDDSEDERSPEPASAAIASPIDKEIAVAAPTSPHPAYRDDYNEQSSSAAAAAPILVPVAAPVQASPPQASPPQTPTQSPAALAAQRAMVNHETSPELAKFNQLKAKKAAAGAGGGGAGGFKKLFGRKIQAPTSQPINGTNATGANLLVPDQPIHRRLSLMRRKQVPKRDATSGVTDAQIAASAAFDAQPAPRSFTSGQDSVTTTSHVDPHDHREAEKEFARFDQDSTALHPPAEEAPAAELAAPEPQRDLDVNAQVASQADEAKSEASRDSWERDDEVAADAKSEAQSEATMENSPDPAVESKDRWAIIRENAARRAAQRASEEQSTQSRPSQSVKTDDGETSGEETIESRVARIKARVAELTGGMDGVAPRAKA